MYLILIFAAFMLVPVGWVAVRLAPWAAPIPGVLGLVLALAGVSAGSARLGLYGGGLFAFSAVMFCLGGGMRDR